MAGMGDPAAHEAGERAEELVARGMGLPGAHGHRGDLRATVRIRVPAHATAEEQQAWERLRDLSRFHPRD